MDRSRPRFRSETFFATVSHVLYRYPGLRFRCIMPTLKALGSAVVCLVWLPASLLGAAAAALAEETALDRYVAKPDATYSWKVVRTVPSAGATQFIVDLKSQTWRSEEDVDRPVWQHWLNIVRPAKPTSNIAWLMIGGGANGGDAPQSADDFVVRTAETTNTVVAELKMVPNQPLVLHGDGVPR